MQLTILGNGAGGPFQGRNYTAQVLQVENHYFLIDCGEGAQHQLYRYRIPYDRINCIFISHLHGDHVFGLIGLLTSYCLKQRSRKLVIYSPPGLQEMIETIARLSGVIFPYLIEFQEVETSIVSIVFENKQLEVSTIPLNHRSACTGWLFREKPRPRNIRKEKIEEYDIAFPLIPGIKAGADLTLPDGRIIPNAELTQPPKPPKAYAFCSDTAPSETVALAVQGVDLLYHEATFIEENVEEARISFHSTAKQAAMIARAATVKKLLLGHFSGRYTDVDQHLAEAFAVFEATEASKEGGVYVV